MNNGRHQIHNPGASLDHGFGGRRQSDARQAASGLQIISYPYEMKQVFIKILLKPGYLEGLCIATPGPEATNRANGGSSRGSWVACSHRRQTRAARSAGGSDWGWLLPDRRRALLKVKQARRQCPIYGPALQDDDYPEQPDPMVIEALADPKHDMKTVCD